VTSLRAVIRTALPVSPRETTRRNDNMTPRIEIDSTKQAKEGIIVRYGDTMLITVWDAQFPKEEEVVAKAIASMLIKRETEAK